MDTQMIIELVGYLGSFLVLVSFLMTSVYKLRIVNTIGSVIFMTYALIIKSYPTAIMNFCLVLINLHFLYKMSHTEKEFELVEVNSNDSYLNYILNRYREDIEKCFPNTSFDLTDVNKCFVVSNNGNPVGITLGKEENNIFDLQIDYSTPEYRDFSIGKFMIEKLKEKGFKKLIYRGPIENHKEYLNKLDYKKENDYYSKNL